MGTTFLRSRTSSSLVQLRRKRNPGKIVSAAVEHCVWRSLTPCQDGKNDNTTP